METFAYIHNAVNFEDPNLATELRSLDELALPVPSSVVVGAIAVGVAAATLGQADDAHALMRQGDRGPGVRQLQESLVIRADGVFGSSTYSSVRSFQARRGLTVDGIAGPQTLRALGLPSNLGPGGGSDRPVSGRAYVTGSVVNLRSSPYGTVVGKLYNGASVSLTGRTSVSGGLRWSQLASGNWVASRYLSTSGGSGDRPISGGAVITGNGVRVRDYPYGPVLYSLNSGNRVSLTGRTSFSGGRSWVQIADGNWVAREFVNVL